MKNENNIGTEAINDLLEAVTSLIEKQNSEEKLRQENAKFIAGVKDALGAITEKLEAAGERQRLIMDRFPKDMEVRIRHRFEGRTRIFSLVFTVSLIVTSLTIGLWYGSWREGVRLRAGDLKYRFHRLTQPQASLHTDTLYSRDPENFKRTVERMEAEREAFEQAEKIARSKEQEAVKARKEAEKLKKKSR